MIKFFSVVKDKPCKKEFILGLQLYYSYKRPAPLPYRGDTVIERLCRMTLSAALVCLSFTLQIWVYNLSGTRPATLVEGCYKVYRFLIKDKI